MDLHLWPKRNAAATAATQREEGVKDEQGTTPLHSESDPLPPFTIRDVEQIGITLIHEFHRQERVRTRNKWLTILGIITLFVAGLSFLGSGVSPPKIPIDPSLYKRVPLVAGGGASKAHVAIIPVTGTIDGDVLGPPEFSNTTRYIAEALLLAKKEKNLVAVIFYVNSTGGDAAASAQGYRLIKQFREQEKNVNVIAYVSRGAYSGGYYLALGAGKIIVDPAATVGNIGVVMHLFNTYEVGHAFGVKEITIKSGPNKDAGSQWKEDNEGDRAMMQRSVDRSFHSFLEAVSESRKIPISTLEGEAKKQSGITSGAWFTADDARRRGLADEVMSIDELLVSIAKGLGETKQYSAVEFVRYDKRLSLVKEWQKDGAKAAQAIGAALVQGVVGEMHKNIPAPRAE